MNKNFQLCLFRILLCALCVFIANSLWAQDKDQLQKRKEELLKEIQLTKQLLSKTKSRKVVSISQVQTLNKQIDVREQLISTIGKEMSTMDVEIARFLLRLDQAQRELQKLKDEYAEMLRYTYKSASSYNKLLYIFAAKDFNQAYKRIKYIQQYSYFRKLQAAQISQKQRAA